MISLRATLSPVDLAATSQVGREEVVIRTFNFEANATTKSKKKRITEWSHRSSNKSSLSYLLVIPITLALATANSALGHSIDLIEQLERQTRLANHRQPDDWQPQAEFSFSTSSGSALAGNSETRDEFLKRQQQPTKSHVGPKSLNEFLENLAVLSVGQKHDVSFECELDATTSSADENLGAGQSKIVWLKLTGRSGEHWAPTDEELQNEQLTPANRTTQEAEFETTLLSLNKRLITPDKRFKISHRPPNKWILTLKNVGQSDDRSFFLCQTSGGGGGESDNLRAARLNAGTRFIGGARLNVLVQPKIIETETSPSSLVVSELEPVRLQCKVASEPQAQISWRREDGRQLDNLEQQFKHQFVRRPNQIISLDSSELIFDSIRREQAGAYLCIASNGVLSGVSQRINVQVENCRAGQQLESCREEQQPAATASQEHDQAGQVQTTAGAQQSAAAIAASQRPSVAGGKFAQTKQQRNWKTTTPANNSKQTADGNSQRPKLRPPSTVASSDRRRNYADLERQKSGSVATTSKQAQEEPGEPSIANGAADCSLIQMNWLVVICLICGRTFWARN